jgi:transposase
MTVEQQKRAIEWFLQKYPTPAQIRGAGKSRVSRLLIKLAPRSGPAGAAAIQTAAHLASYAGIAPVTRRSGTSIRGEQRSKRGNKKLKSALYLAAFASLGNPVSRTYYDRKRAEGMRHHQAVMALTRKRCNVLFAILRDSALFDGKRPKTA